MGASLACPPSIPRGTGRGRYGRAQRGSRVRSLAKTLCRTAVSLARRRQARNARCCSLEELSATPHHIRELRAPEPVAARDNFDANLDLTRLMIGLSQRRRAVVVARLIDGLSTKETAHLLGCSTGTVKATLHAALGILREQLACTAATAPAHDRGGMRFLHDPPTILGRE